MDSPHNTFARNLLSSILDGEQKNIIVSPLSVYFALSLVATGAQGKGLDEIAKSFGNVNGSKIPELVAPVRKAFESSKNATVTVANNLFVAQGSKLKKKYLDDTLKYFDVKILQKDFFFSDSKASVQEINAWVNGVTRGMITQVFEEISKNAKIILANAIYFKATWELPFQEYDTKMADFHVTSKKKVQVSMMRKCADEEVGENDVAKWIRLPYRGRDYSAVFILPKEAEGVKKTGEFLFGKSAPKLSSRSRASIVEIPKFKFEFTSPLQELLQKLGIVSIFTDYVLTDIVEKENLTITQAIHKAVIAVDEKGTTAAAVTAFEGEDECEADDEEPFYFIANRPFYVLIEHKSEAILFAGLVSDPSVLN